MGRTGAIMSDRPYICQLHSNELFTEIPASAVEIGNNRRFKVIRTKDGVTHLLQRIKKSEGSKPEGVQS